MNFRLFPDSASSVAPQVDLLLLALVALSLLFMGLIFLPMTYFAFKYRRGRKVDRTPPRFAEWKLEVIWMVLPFLMMLGLFAWGAAVYFHIERPPANALDIDVVGKQWMWKMEHPEGVREINEIHVPIGSPVRLVMTSQDVIHDFFIPAFRVKQDVVPGKYTTEWFIPTKVGAYHIFCSQYCGTDHSKMVGQVVVMKRAAYEDWLASGQPADSLALAGSKLFTQLGCSGCHSGTSQVHAPILDGVYGKPVPQEGNRFVMANEQYLRDCILMPNSVHIPGYQNVMPTFQGHVTEDQLLELIAYIKSLAQKEPQEIRKANESE